jgi:hypothetical protein
MILRLILALAAWSAAGLALAQPAGPPGTREITGTLTTDTATTADYRATIVWRSTANAGKTQTLPACGTFNNGFPITVVDGQKTAGIYPITINAAGGSTVSGPGPITVTIDKTGGGLTLTCDGVATAWLVTATNASGGGVVIDTTAPGTTTITAAQWNSGQRFISAAAGHIYQLPAATTVDPQRGILIETLGDPATLKPAATDGINGGVINTSITLPPNFTAQVVSSGAGGTTAFYTPLGASFDYAFSWGEGINLSAAPRYVNRTQFQRAILKITCNVTTAAGTAGKVNVFSVPNGTAPASGTRLDNLAGCNVNTASNTAQDMGITVAIIPADSTIFAIFTGTGLLGNGGLTISAY